jgi:small subunit ribosomal protein S4
MKMGHPKKLRKKYESPRKPFADLESERNLMRDFGLVTKRELWRAETELRNLRRRARAIQAKKESGRGSPEEEESMLIKKLIGFGLDINSLDDILKLSLSDMLERRLQTIIYKKGITITVKQARQLIVHGHVRIDGKRVKFPSFIVSKEQEAMIECDMQPKSRANQAGAESAKDAEHISEERVEEIAKDINALDNIEEALNEKAEKE